MSKHQRTLKSERRMEILQLLAAFIQMIVFQQKKNVDLHLRPTLLNWMNLI